MHVDELRSDKHQQINHNSIIVVLHSNTDMALLINPRRACAARVTVVVLCVCVCVSVCVCLRLFSHYRLRGGL